MPPIPAEQQSPFPCDNSQPEIVEPLDHGQRTDAKGEIPDPPAQPSANSARGPPRVLWDRATVLAFFGGISVGAFYRGIAAKRYPRPVMVSPNVARWLASECEARLEELIAERDGRKRVRTSRIGAHRLHRIQG
jgi:predicted DNA-binding transcriptional regulator AlpA